MGEDLSDYFLPFHPYGHNHTNQKKFEVNSVALMAHAFTSLLLVDHDFFCKMTQDLDPRLQPVGISKLLQSLTHTANNLLERSVIERLAKVKAVVTRYDLWMSQNMEEISR